jgi:hydroxymethylbilane synthase
MTTTTPGPATLRIGTRGSALALVQATLVRDALAASGVPAELVTITTDGDRRAPDTAWGEGAFVTAIESALLGGEVDVAVHSAKDLPTDEDPRLSIAAYAVRADPGDAVVLRAGSSASSLDDLPIGSRVGTDSPRRTAFLRAVRPDLAFHPLHGNVDTRLRKLDAGESDALVLAVAGLTRLGRADRISFQLDPELVPPAPGQGALAIQVRAGDATTAWLVARLDDPATRAAVEAERALLAASGGGCRAPIGALGRVRGNQLDLLGGFARPDGSIAIVRHRHGSFGDAGVIDGLLDVLAAEGAAATLALGGPPIIVTRSADQAPALLLALVDRGFAALSVPAISIEAGGDGLAPALERLDEFDWVVATSVNAVRAIHTEADRAGRPLNGASGSPGPRWAAVGVASARALRAAGIPIGFRPARAAGAALADTLPFEPGARILFPRSEIADPATIERLAARGAIVESVVAYRTLEGPESSLGGLAAALRESPRAIVFTSGSTVRGLVALAVRANVADEVRRLPAICIGQETATEARRLGFDVAAEARSQGVGGIADAAAKNLIPNEDER